MGIQDWNSGRRIDGDKRSHEEHKERKEKKLDAEGRVTNWYHIRSEKQKSRGKKENCIDWKTDEKTLQKEFKYSRIQGN